jgi:glutamyl-tRNA reductase
MSFLNVATGAARKCSKRHFYSFTDLEAIRHVFRVTSSLDSMVVGEPQITGQVKQAFQLAQDARTVGHQLNRLMSRAFAVAKRVRNETGIGLNSVSISFVAVELARRVFRYAKGRYRITSRRR